MMMMIVKQIDRPQWCELCASIKTDDKRGRTASNRANHRGGILKLNFAVNKRNLFSNHHLVPESPELLQFSFQFSFNFKLASVGHLCTTRTTDDNCRAIIALTLHEVICHLPTRNERSEPNRGGGEREAEFISGTYGTRRGRIAAKPHPLPEYRRTDGHFQGFLRRMHERKKCKKSICDH